MPKQILPTNMLLSFAEAREGVPFSSVVELIFLELAFELIREAGVRVPGSLGNAIGIVGGLVIGQAAVEANLVSPIVVMIVALTALGSMTVPNEEFAAAVLSYLPLGALSVPPPMSANTRPYPVFLTTPCFPALAEVRRRPTLQYCVWT